MYTDRTLTCADCGQDFVFTAGEQEFFASKGFSSDPRRCPECRRKRKEPGQRREMHEATCAECGKKTQVPFKPSGVRPVYCSDCFKKGAGH
ncbi:zinc-ribbon domain containing protein [bacterium]|nr:zinc-ribbon domain containing protein [bacterium]